MLDLLNKADAEDLRIELKKENDVVTINTYGVQELPYSDFKCVSADEIVELINRYYEVRQRYQELLRELKRVGLGPCTD